MERPVLQAKLTTACSLAQVLPSSAVKVPNGFRTVICKPCHRCNLTSSIVMPGISLYHDVVHLSGRALLPAGG